MDDREFVIFALTASDELPDLSELTSFEDHPVEHWEVDGLAAIVARWPEKRLRPRRSNLKIHHRIIDYLVDQGASPLPFAFGTSAPRDELTPFIGDHHEEFKQRIQALRGCVETTIKVQARAGEFYEFLIQSTPSLAAFRDRVYDSQGEPSREEKIELGRRVEGAKEAVSTRLTEELIDAVSPVVADSSQQPLGGEEQLVHLVLLVERDRRGELEAAIDGLASTWDDALVIQLSPYLAPYYFANLKL